MIHLLVIFEFRISKHHNAYFTDGETIFTPLIRQIGFLRGVLASLTTFYSRVRILVEAQGFQNTSRSKAFI